MNRTGPQLTEHCWLCLDIRPPFYEAIGVLEKARRANGTNPPSCGWGDKQAPGITLASVTGRGRCVGKIPAHMKSLCGNITKVGGNKTADWLIPANNTKWICSKGGLIPCISLKSFNASSDFCIQVVIIPKIIYHPLEYIYDQQSSHTHLLRKREPFTALTVATLMLIGGAGVSTGVASFVKQSKEFHSLRVAVDKDLDQSKNLYQPWRSQ